ncbi:MAG TPA: hypothetical protein EYP59_19870 [Thiotrichaceae bacterium]|nr:hypothetical protein [Thiotrichaceae bacterium]
MNHINTNILGDDFGFVFELGINIGILAGIRHLTTKKKLLSKVHPLYDEELKKLKLSQIVSRLQAKAKKNGVVDPTLLKNTERFIEYLVFLGVHKGFNFIVEYCQGLDDAMKAFRSEPLPLQMPKANYPTLLYYQCDLQPLFNSDDYVRYDLLTPKLEQMFKHIDSQLQPDYQRYQQRGQFLNADIIMLFHLHDRYRIVVIDVGLFSVADITQVPDLQDVSIVKQRLFTTYGYMCQKTAFEQILMDSDKAGIHYSAELADYFEAFSRDDKDSYKMIQAGGYAHSFVQCLTALLPERFHEEALEVNAIGLTDRAYNATFISDKADLPILGIFQTIYQQSKQQTQGIPYPENRLVSITSVFESIFKNFKRTFRQFFGGNSHNLTTFVEKLRTLPFSDKGITQSTYTEVLKDFFSTADQVPPEILAEVGLEPDSALTFRDAHARLITQAMYNDDLLLFLTGHPGIGKTTAIVEYILTQPILSEGVLFFYFSPRTQVNYDIVEKLSRLDNGKRIVKDDSLICIYSNSTLINSFDGQPVIKYVSNTPLPPELKMPSAVGGKQSILKLVPDEQELVFHKSRYSHSQSSSDNKMAYNHRFTQGVLNTVCSAICTLRHAHYTDKTIPKNIVATATVQSLKKTATKTTAEHLRRLFAEAAIDKQLKDFDDVKLAQIAKTTRHVIFMVDEVIGDSGGSDLLHELVKIAQKFHKHFKVKIIASDASIAGKDVIKQHLSKREPSPAKILYRQVDKAIDAKPLSIQQDQFKIGFSKWDGTIINANTFPARELVLSYKVGAEVRANSAFLEKREKRNTDDAQQAWLLKDIFKLLRDPAHDGQILVYIQNINYLRQLIAQLSQNQFSLPSGSFEKFKDYLEIHSSISDTERQQIHKHKNAVKIIFMTSSASRGITFARARYIFIQVPKFQIENNLMEIVQTVYRGRGGDTAEERALETQTRWLTFYLHDRIYYSDWQPREERYQRGITGLMNIILLVRAAVQTRITGLGDIGEQHELRIIPVGGKHVDSVGDSLLTGVAKLLSEMKREISRNLESVKVGQAEYNNSLTKLKDDIRTIFQRTQTRVASDTLKKVDIYYEQFSERSQNSLYDLLNYRFEPSFYIDGDIFIVPIPKSEERVNIPKDLLNAVKSEGIVEKMQGHASDAKYTNNLRTALSKVAKEIEKMQQASEDTSKSQDIYSQNSSGCQYLAIPLPVLFQPEIFKQYFSPHSETKRYEAETTEGDSFIDVLGNYLYLLYQVVDKLPLDGGYETFPFLLFRSDNVTIIRQQRFDRRYLFSSTTFNLINLVLSQKNRD